jgi:hypothetical protein
MSRKVPPRWLETALLSLLSARDRETIAGDLQEEFSECKVDQLGKFRACLWYARQTSSFVPRRIMAMSGKQMVLMGCSLITGASGLWLGLMDFLLKHPGYLSRELIAGAIVGEAMVTIAALLLPWTGFRWLAIAGCIPMYWLAVTATRAMLRGNHPEGYVLLIALILVVQSSLALLILPPKQDGRTLRA